ncbi:hypothetical protein GGTG_02546 [Gaeumannomyces tritici R3-111a-1]|uniref:CENP-V/GFA domain-containing protein n=1 Tax=Gaeumannomyces tritici (strain R3-111a-1) TaxID=644352 RepID=J3NMP0_GAET3|nr:hypothetical protein GGTG_02546 [Gaeumannomyces tritici R3-111a-1]EJT82573.1 hypothetical protein GGTG_02546 [Gaeumannomyces tritici R3-111a-1]
MLAFPAARAFPLLACPVQPPPSAYRLSAMGAQAAAEHITITARCICGAQVYTAPVSVSTLPLRAVCSHCDSCRRMTGGLYFAETTWPPCISDLSGDGGVDLSELKRYSFSASICIFSCATCPSFLFCKRGLDEPGHENGRGSWSRGDAAEMRLWRRRPGGPESGVRREAGCRRIGLAGVQERRDVGLV